MRLPPLDSLDSLGRRGRAGVIAGFAAALLAALWAVHHTAFGAPFYFDSLYHIVDKPNYHLTRISLGGLLRAARGADDATIWYRPLAGLTFAFTHYFGGLDPRWYRAGNLAIHWLSSLSVLWLCRELLGAQRVRETTTLSDGERLAVALLATALWSLHPVHTNVVSYVVQRMASLSGLFSFVAVAAYLRARRAPAAWSTGWVAAALGAWALGLGSKETALLVPLYFLVVEWFVLAPSPKGRERLFLGTLFALGVAASVAFAAWKGRTFLGEVAEVYRARAFTPWERLLTEAVVLIRYLTVLLVPDPRLLTIDAEIPVSKGLFSPPTTFFAVLGLGLALVLAFRVRRRKPLVGFAIAWFAATQVMESTVLALELYFEHRLYLAAVGVFLVLAYGVLALRRRGPGAFAAACCVATAFLAAETFGTAYRTRFWANPILLYDDVVAKSPHNVRAYANLSHYLIGYDRLAEAEQALDLAEARVPDLKSSPYYENILYNRATIALQRNEAAKAVALLEKAAALNGPTAWRCLRTLARTQLLNGNLEEARRSLARAFALRPADSGLFLLKGKLHLAEDDLAAAKPALRAAVLLDPLNGEAWAALGLIAGKEGRLAEARAFLARGEEAGFEVRLPKGEPVGTRRPEGELPLTRDRSSRSSR